MTIGPEGQIVYNFATIAEATSAIDTAVSQMRSTLADLEQALRPLESEAWTSTAQEAYLARKQRWTEASDNIATLLERVKNAVAKASEDMMTADNRAAEYFRSSVR